MLTLDLSSYSLDIPILNICTLFGNLNDVLMLLSQMSDCLFLVIMSNAS